MTVTSFSGLEGVVAAETHLSCVDGERGSLLLHGYPVEELAPAATFEETAWLFWHGRRPNAAEREALRAELAGLRTLPEAVLALLREAAREEIPAMDALRMAAAGLTLGCVDGDVNREAKRATAAFPVIVAAYQRLRAGQEVIEPREDLGHAANFLYMLSGDEPDAARVRALETYLNTVVDHGLNASTFTARVIISTGSDLISAVVGAVGALKGPLHGGAPGPALQTVFDIGTAENARPFLRAKLERGERLMGFGHRVYRVRDPRAEVLSEAAQRLATSGRNRELYELATHVERVALELLAEFKPDRRLNTNVEYYTALLLHGLDFHQDVFSSIFAMARVVGWCAHSMEQIAVGRLIRPKGRYVGTKRAWDVASEA
ncbi:Citrate synthase [Sulfidibacter corallicola]|uniref:Citrate synthase n=1 Tax=Sulfidibacter corallicola TaxID=2818388 RepID=A0A8A4TMV4_SULCO|nr:citrate synthase/methylcitrate synthase [Sulfidibacter corallicola]QTD50880.1 citrate synthase/methylcitrate synthase [Sulfidibacter corallicola]